MLFYVKSSGGTEDVVPSVTHDRSEMRGGGIFRFTEKPKKEGKQATAISFALCRKNARCYKCMVGWRNRPCNGKKGSRITDLDSTLIEICFRGIYLGSIFLTPLCRILFVDYQKKTEIPC